MRARQWATYCLDLHQLVRLRFSETAWAIEAYQRELKQFCGVQAPSVRSVRSQHNHIGLAIRPFLRLELHPLRSGRSWFDLKFDIIRSALRAYLLNSLFFIPSA